MHPDADFINISEFFCKEFGGSSKTAAVLKNSAAVFEKTARVFGKTAAVFSEYLCNF